MQHRSRISWTPEQWASAGYVLITIRERSGIEDPIYIKRRFRSPVITAHEWEQLKASAKRQHLINSRRRFADTDRLRAINAIAFAPYRAYAEQQRVEQRRKAVAEGHISLDEMTFFDLL